MTTTKKEMIDEARYNEVKKFGCAAYGKKYLLAHLSGAVLSVMQAVHAKCYECMGYFLDGKVDCGLATCPLYPFMRYNPNRLSTKNRQKRVYSPEEKARLAAQLSKGRKHGQPE